MGTKRQKALYWMKVKPSFFFALGGPKKKKGKPNTNCYDYVPLLRSRPGGLAGANCIDLPRRKGRGIFYTCNTFGKVFLKKSLFNSMTWPQTLPTAPNRLIFL